MVSNTLIISFEPLHKWFITTSTEKTMSLKDVKRNRKPILTDSKGRPVKKTQLKKKRNLYLSDSQYQALVEKAAEDGQDFSSFVRSYLIKHNLIPTE